MPAAVDPSAPPPVEAPPPPPVGDAVAVPAPRWWPWAVGLLLGLVVVGPGLSGGSLLNVDLLVTPDIPVPNGIYGLGPALSQRVPLFAVLGLGSDLVGGPVATKAFLVACIAVGFAGAARLARVLAGPGQAPGALGLLAAGLLWAGGPYALTRAGVGHVNLVWLVAVLPWALPRLSRPAEHLPSTFLAALAVAIGGPGGGTLGVAIAAVALVLQPAPRRWLRPGAAVLVPQLVWVGPTAVLLWAGAGVAGAHRFATRAEGITGWPALGAGGGFWRADQQVGAVGWVGAVAGVVVLVLAFVGGRSLVARCGWRSWPGAATAAALLGLGLTAASAVPGLRAVYDGVSELSIGAPLRESHRFAALWLVWAAPVVPLGAAELARRWTADRHRLSGTAVRCLPLVVALSLSVPGWWGIGGRMAPVEFPPSWAAARQVVHADPGTLLALPWSEYPALPFADGRQAFNPMPDYFGGDVLSSYDPRFDLDEPAQEQVDPRAPVVDEAVRRLWEGEAIGADLRDLGIRWVVLADEPSADRYAALATDADLDRVLDLPDLDLYAVRGWRGPVVAPDGTVHDVDRPIPPVIRTDAPAGSVIDMAGAPGWVRGPGHATQVTDDGRLRLGAGSGPVWFWPAAVLVALDLALVGAAIWAARSRRRSFGRILAPRVARG